MTGLFDQPGEQPHLTSLVGQLFGMPLHGDDSPVPILEPLDGPVFGPGNGPQVMADPVAPLVVYRVHAEVIRADDAPELALRVDMDGMDQLTSAFDVLVGLGGHCGQVLHERASSGHVDQLHTPADSQDRKTRGRRFAEQGDLRVIAFDVHPAGLGIAVRPVELGGDIAPARKHDAIQVGEHRAEG